MALTLWGTGMSWANGDREEKTESRELLGLLDEQPPPPFITGCFAQKV